MLLLMTIIFSSENETHQYKATEVSAQMFHPQIHIGYSNTRCIIIWSHCDSLMCNKVKSIIQV